MQTLLGLGLTVLCLKIVSHRCEISCSRTLLSETPLNKHI